MNSSKYINYFFYCSYALFFISLVCSFRGFASIGIGLILVAGIVKNRIDHGLFIAPDIKNIFFISCCCFFFLQVILMLFSTAQAGTAQEIQLKSGLILVPLAICCGNYTNRPFYEKIMTLYISVIAAAMAFCVITALYNYFFLLNDHSVFFYHALVSPFHQHAVQVSIMLFIGLVHLLEAAKQQSFFKNSKIHLILICYFSILIIMLSSKLVIVVTAVCLLYYLPIIIVSSKQTRKTAVISIIVCLASITTVLLTNNVVSKRFREILNTDMALIKQKDFNPGIYFNGVQFRLLQVRFVKEILTENNAWYTGVSKRSQELLIKKYASTHMYLGDGKNDPGYMRYNTHDQFLESILIAGIPGMIGYFFVFLSMIILVLKRKNTEFFFIASILLLYSLNESVLEKQFSIMLFTFFPLMIYYGTEKNNLQKQH